MAQRDKTDPTKGTDPQGSTPIGSGAQKSRRLHKKWPASHAETPRGIQSSVAPMTPPTKRKRLRNAGDEAYKPEEEPEEEPGDDADTELQEDRLAIQYRISTPLRP